MMDLDLLPDLNYYYHSKKLTPDGIEFYTYIGLRFWYITQKRYPELLTMTSDQVRAFIKRVHWCYVEDLKQYLREALCFNLGDALSSYSGTRYHWNNRVRKDEIEWVNTINELLN